MEKDRGNGPEDQSDNSSEKKKKDSKKRDGFRVPLLPVEQGAEKSKEEPKKLSALEEALAGLATRRREEEARRAEESATESKTSDAEDETHAPIAAAEQETKESETPESQLAEKAAEVVEAEYAEDMTKAHEDEEPLRDGAEYIIPSGGEVIYHSAGDVPAEEMVLFQRGAENEPARQPELHAEQPSAEFIPEETPESEHAPDAEPMAFPSIEAWPNAAHYEAERPAEHVVSAPQPAEAPVATYAEVLPPEQEIYTNPNERPATKSDLGPYGPYGEGPATKRAVEDAIYYATKSGQQRGLVTGLFAGGLYEHFKHRRREKKAEKRFNKQSKQHEAVEQNYKFGQQEQERQKSESNRELAASEKRYTDLEYRTAEELRAGQGQQPEKLMVRTPEQVAAENPEQLVVQDGHRLEASAWHSIEIDNKTGKAVENPAFVYGEEFQHERAPENVGNRFDDDNDPQTFPTQPEIVNDLAAASQIPSATTRDGDATPPAHLPNATVQGPPESPKDKAKAALTSLTQPDNPLHAGPIWPWLLALVIIALLLLILL